MSIRKEIIEKHESCSNFKHIMEGSDVRPRGPIEATALEAEHSKAQLHSKKQLSSEEEWQVEMVGKCLAGDETAFAMVIDKFSDVLLRTAYLLLRDEEAAKDTVQESFILAWKNMKQLREHMYLRAWLLKIVVNQATSLRRQLARRANLLREQIMNYVVDTSIQIADVQRGHLEDTLDLGKALERLPLEQKTVLILFYYQNMPMSEIAEILGVPENTLRKRLQLALQKLRRVLTMDGQTQPVATGYRNKHNTLGTGAQK